MSMCQQPALGFIVQWAQRGAGGNHHPHRGFRIRSVLGPPLPFRHQERPQRLRVSAPQHIIQARPKRFIVTRITHEMWRSSVSARTASTHTSQTRWKSVTAFDGTIVRPMEVADHCSIHRELTGA